MSRHTTLEDRLQIVGLAEAGLTDTQIAQQTGWSKHTVRKWRRRSQRSGPDWGRKWGARTAVR
jgi:transposase-like protein